MPPGRVHERFGRNSLCGGSERISWALARKEQRIFYTKVTAYAVQSGCSRRREGW